MAEDMVEVVLEHDCNNYGFAMIRGVGAMGEYVFKKGVPQKVPRVFAESLVASNPEPWQGGGHHVFKIVEPVEVAEPDEE